MKTEESSYSCKECHDVGFVYPFVNGRHDYSQSVACKCRAGDKMERLIRYCELPAKSENLTFDTFQDKGYPSLKEAKESAQRLAEQSGELDWLTLTGSVDLGKTHLAIAIVRRWLERGKPAKYVFVPDMLVWLRDAYDQSNNGDLTFAQRLKMLKEVPLLVLDDMGTQKPTLWAMEQITVIIDHRYLNHLPLVVTTNKSVDAIPGDDEGRISSRLRRYVPGEVILVEAPEYRKRRNQR